MIQFSELFRAKDINAGIRAYRNTPDAVLLDVRTEEEYIDRHIPRALNIPLDELEEVAKSIPDRNTPIFVHCLSGARSETAVAALKKMGYTHVTNIGGIRDFDGKVERGE